MCGTSVGQLNSDPPNCIFEVSFFFVLSKHGLWQSLLSLLSIGNREIILVSAVGVFCFSVYPPPVNVEECAKWNILKVIKMNGIIVRIHHDHAIY